jgi:hypothetical protein
MSDEVTIVLYRPVGAKELELVRGMQNRGFPPRLPHQPIFYPVVTEEYAVQIARDWNTKDAASGYAGFVTRFRIREEFITRYAIQTVGNSIAKEYWVPAEELDEFNSNIVGLIEVIHEFRGGPGEHR